MQVQKMVTRRRKRNEDRNNSFKSPNQLKGMGVADTEASLISLYALGGGSAVANGLFRAIGANQNKTVIYMNDNNLILRNEVGRSCNIIIISVFIDYIFNVANPFLLIIYICWYFSSRFSRASHIG